MNRPNTDDRRQMNNFLNKLTLEQLITLSDRYNLEKSNRKSALIIQLKKCIMNEYGVPPVKQQVNRASIRTCSLCILLFMIEVCIMIFIIKIIVLHIHNEIYTYNLE